MRRLKHNFKKGMAFVLSLAMVAGLVPAMSGGANTVQAATGSGTEPSVTAYATKDQLMTAFTPDANGTATTKGKLVFGKKSDGTTAQEWYILGKDTGVSGDNTIIVAASPIARGQKFNSDISNKNDENLWSDCVYSEATITEVYANHYGASELRDTLQGMATNTSYFTSAEQGLMNATTVTTKDTKNSSVTYTTTDKLYALQGDYDNDQYLWAGTDDSTVLAMSSYLRNGEWFWLRSPYGRSGDIALCADRGYYVILGRVDIDSGSPVQPASNLDLSSVLFASAATAASSDTKSEKITDSAAMTLRLDGTGKDIGTATYNTTTGDIKAVKGTTSQTVALVVQGNDGTNNWYYSKKITSFKFVQHGGILNRVASRKNFGGKQPAFYRYEYSGQHNPNECHDVAVNSYGCRFRLYEINHVACEKISDKRIYRHQIDAAFALRKAIEEKNHHNADGREHIDRIAVQNPCRQRFY